MVKRKSVSLLFCHTVYITLVYFHIWVCCCCMLVQQENCLAGGNVHMSLITRMLTCLSGDNYYSYKKLWEEIMKPTLSWQNSSLTNPSTWTSYWDDI